MSTRRKASSSIWIRSSHTGPWGAHRHALSGAAPKLDDSGHRRAGAAGVVRRAAEPGEKVGKRLEQPARARHDDDLRPGAANRQEHGVGDGFWCRRAGARHLLAHLVARALALAGAADRAEDYGRGAHTAPAVVVS